MVPYRRHPAVPGVHIHRTRQLLPRDVRIRERLPVTSPARTLLDRAGTLTTRELERELDEALTVLKIVRVPQVQAVLDRAHGRPGAALLRRLLHNRTHETVTREEAERLFLGMIREAGLPEPETQVWLEGFSVDFLWRAQRVIFEIDGYTFHTSRSAFDRDRRKDLVMKAAGWDPNRVSRDQVKFERLTVLAHVAGALARASRAA
jgi:very-short-patch-repair endonuclease